MAKGKSTCKVLKEIRQRIADANGISYQPHECHYEGDCPGTCPACEQELRYLEKQLKEHSRSGLGAKVAGVAAGVCVAIMPLSAAAQSADEAPVVRGAAPVIKKDTIQVKDLSGGRADSVTVRGKVVGATDGEPLIGASILLEGTNKGTVTDMDGMFAVRVPADGSLVVKYIGYNDKTIKVEDLSTSWYNAIVLDDNDLELQGEVVVLGEVSAVNGDDMYYRQNDKPKSHKEKCEKQQLPL